MRSGGTPLPSTPPGQTTAPSPQVMTTISCGTLKSRRFSGSLPSNLRSASRSVPNGPRDDLLRLRVDDVVRVGLARSPATGRAREARRARRARPGTRRIAIDGPVERGLEVVELELRRRADDLRGGRGVLDARELDDDLVRRPACGSRARVTPSLSTRFRMMSTERLRSSSVSSRFGGGTAWSVTSSPPCRSSPSVGS